MAPMRIVLMATGPFALPTMRWLIDAPHELVCWVTRPPRLSGRRRTIPPSPLRELARTRQVPIWEPEDINAPESVAHLHNLGADLLVVCDYGQILAAEVLEAARLGGINLHGSLLPKYRGAAPVQWAIYHGETETGVSVIHMTPRLDAGPILQQRRTAIGPEEDAQTLEARLAELGVGAVEAAIEQLAAWDGHSPIGTPQDASLATRAPRLRKEHGRIDFRRSADEIERQVRAMRPWPGTYTTWARPGKPPMMLRIERVSVVPSSPETSDLAGGAPGTICAASGDRLWVRTGEGILAIEQLCPAGKRSQGAAEFLRGYRLAPGDRWGDDSPAPSGG